MTNLGFFSKDLNRQITAAQMIIDALKLIQELEMNANSGDMERMKRAKGLLESAAAQLIDNAAETGREISKIGSAA